MHISEKRGPGRPPKAPSQDRRHTVTSKLSPAAFAQLQEAAERNLQSISKEVDDRILRTLAEDRRAGTHHAAMFLQAVSVIIWSIEQQTGEEWTEDFFTGLSVRSALIKAIDGLLPKPADADLEQLASLDLLDRPAMSQALAEQVDLHKRRVDRALELGGIAGADAAADLARKLKRER